MSVWWQVLYDVDMSAAYLLDVRFIRRYVVGDTLDCHVKINIHARTIPLTKNMAQHARTKHIDVIYDFVQDIIEEHNISLMKCMLTRILQTS